MWLDDLLTPQSDLERRGESREDGFTTMRLADGEDATVHGAKEREKREGAPKNAQ
jgi:hypothetical protein